MNRRLTKDQTGFTIVELMIATSVLSVILLLATLIMTSIGSLYTKGINQSNVQGVTRTITDDISQNLELSNGLVTATTGPNGEQGFCVGSTRYSYVLHVQIGSASHPEVLWRDTLPAGGCVAADLSATPTSGSEMLGPHMRLANLDIQNNSGVYTVTVYVAYGDDDLLTGYNTNTPVCSGGAASKFCSTSALTTDVVPRIVVQ